MVELDARTLDLAGIVRPGDTVFRGHGTSEPVVLSEARMRQRAGLGRFQVFLGPTFSTTPQPIHADHIDFLSYRGIGANQAPHEQLEREGHALIAGTSQPKGTPR